jgi:hypothetical protein
MNIAATVVKMLLKNREATPQKLPKFKGLSTSAEALLSQQGHLLVLRAGVRHLWGQANFSLCDTHHIWSPRRYQNHFYLSQSRLALTPILITENKNREVLTEI